MNAMLKSRLDDIRASLAHLAAAQAHGAVEDDEDIAMVLGRLLPSWFETVVVGTVADGNAALRSVVFDAVLADYHLPDGTGAEVLKLAAELRPDARRVLWSGEPHALHGRPHCAHVVLAKPLDLKSLREALGGDSR